MNLTENGLRHASGPVQAKHPIRYTYCQICVSEIQSCLKTRQVSGSLNPSQSIMHQIHAMPGPASPPQISPYPTIPNLPHTSVILLLLVYASYYHFRFPLGKFSFEFSKIHFFTTSRIISFYTYPS